MVQSFGTRRAQPEPEPEMEQPPVLLPPVRMPPVQVPVVLLVDATSLAQASEQITTMVADAIRAGIEQGAGDLLEQVDGGWAGPTLPEPQPAEHHRV